MDHLQAASVSRLKETARGMGIYEITSVPTQEAPRPAPTEQESAAPRPEAGLDTPDSSEAQATQDEAQVRFTLDDLHAGIAQLPPQLSGIAQGIFGNMSQARQEQFLGLASGIAAQLTERMKAVEQHTNEQLWAADSRHMEAVSAQNGLLLQQIGGLNAKYGRTPRDPYGLMASIAKQQAAGTRLGEQYAPQRLSGQPGLYPNALHEQEEFRQFTGIVLGLLRENRGKILDWFTGSNEPAVAAEPTEKSPEPVAEQRN